LLAGYFLVQSTLIYVVGIRVFAKLHHDDDVSFPGATAVTLITCLAVVVPAAELFHRLVEVPSKIFAHMFYDFITS
jgi:peptidoglycan/LPS O-acetylase OafA/YrhL